ncbi:MAG: S-layer homology domain-containing protein [Actinomycetota bacterium]
MVKAYQWHSVLALATVFGTIANGILPGSTIAPALAEAKFRDVKDYWAQACIENLAEQKIISGYYEDGTFRPERPVTRAEFAAMVRKAFPNAKPVRNAMEFIDVPTDYWAAQAIKEAYQTGFLSGYSGSTFNPTLNISRWQVVVALANGLNYSPSSTALDNLQDTFEDAGDIPSLARNAIAAATEKQLVVNYPNVNRLNPNEDASRAEVAAFLCQAVAKSGQTALVPRQYIAQLATTNQTKTQIEAVESGKVRAEFSYQRQGEITKNFRIKVMREGKTLLDDAVLIPTRSLADNPDTQKSEEVSEGKFLSMQVRDLDGDGEAEILVDLVSTKSGKNCCNYSFIYRYEPKSNQYSVLKHFWGNVSYDLEDLDRNNIPEFKSQDGRFAEAFTTYADSRLPLRIWRYSQGKMLEVTKQYPLPVYTNASELWLESSKRQSENQEIKGVLAAYLANKYLLNEQDEGWRRVQQLYQGSDRADFFAKLRQFIQKTGYASSNDTAGQGQEKPNPTPNPTPSPTNEEKTVTVKLIRTLAGNQSPILSVAMSPNGQILASGSNREIKLWNVQTGEVLRTLSGHTGNVWSVAFSPDGKSLISGSGDGTAILWDINTGQIRRILSHSGWVNAVGFSSDGKTAISCSHNKGIKLWEVQTGKLLNTLDGFNPMAIAAFGRTFASSGGPSAIKLWDSVTGELRDTLAVPEVSGGGIRAIALSRDGLLLANAMAGHSQVQVWDLRKRQAIYTLEGHLDTINAIAFSPDGQILATSSQDRTLKLWNLRTGKVMNSIVGLGAIAFSQDGKILASATQDNSIQIWGLSAR